MGVAACGGGQENKGADPHPAARGGTTSREAIVLSFDGTPLATTFFPAAGLQPGEQAPTVLHAHRWGYVRERDPEGASEDDYGYVGVGALRRAGFNVLTWDARGYGESGGLVELQAPDAEGRDVGALLDYVAQQPEAQLDGPADPRVGMVGTSYGGGLQLVAASLDSRIEAIVPDIGWHSLTDSLYKNGAVKLGWATFLFSYGLRNTGGRYDPHIRSAYTSAVASGKLSDEDFAWFASRGPGDRAAQVRAATLITQSTVDTLFPLSEGIANYQALAGTGVPLKMVWFCGMHGLCTTGNGAPGWIERETIDWLRRYVRQDVTISTGPGFAWIANDGVIRAADRYPPPPGSPLRGVGSGTLVFTAATDAGGSGAFLGATPAVNAVDIALETPAEGTDLVGTPTLSLSYVGRATPDKTFVYAQLLDLGRAEVLGHQATPIPVTLDGNEHSITLPIEAIAAHAGNSSRLVLQLAPSSATYYPQTSSSQVQFTRIAVEVPTVRALP